MARRLRKRLRPRALVLMYHRVADVNFDPWSMCVSPRHFAEHLEVLQKRGFVMPLRQLIQALEAGNLPRRAVIITFDDGYADNLYHAKPLLERYDVPATIFLATGYIGCQREFWWDELDRLLLQPGVLPETLQLTVNGSAQAWQLGEAARYGKQAAWQYRSWKAREEVPSARHMLYHLLWQQLYALPEGEKRKILDELIKWAGVTPAGRASHRSLSQQEVIALAEGELIEIGAHTVTHPALSTLPVPLQREEIQGSKKHLEELLERPVRSFTYPHGDYTEETAALVREAGFACACSTRGEVVRRDADLFQLPRLEVQDWDGEAFERKLRQWL